MPSNVIYDLGLINIETCITESLTSCYVVD
jgi:hypothetical protein